MGARELTYGIKKNKSIRLMLFLIGFILINVGCKHDPILPVRDVCFESEVLPIFITNCTKSGCHGNGSSAEGYTLDNYDGIMKGVKPWFADKSKHIKEITSGNMPVPPNQPLTADQIQVIKDWINGGALNTTNCDTSTSCDTTSVTYSGQVVSILNKYCIGCHNTSFAQGGVDVSTYTGVKNEVNNGRLWGSVNFDAGYSPMPKGGNQISACELAQIKKWIDNGAPNN